MNEDTAGVGALVVSAVSFGTLGIFGKYAATAGLSIPPVLVWRFLLGGAVVWARLALRGDANLLTGRTLAVAVVLGLAGYGTMSGLYFLGLEYMTAGLVGIVLYTYPAFVVLLAAYFGKPFTRRTAVALCVSFGGVAIITGADPAGASLVGVAIVLAAAVVYATYIVVSDTVLDEVDPQTLTAHVLPGGAVTYLFVGAVTGQLAVPATTNEWSIVLGIAVFSTAVPILTFFYGLRIVGASRASIVSTVEPVATVILGAALLGEPVTSATVFGGVLVLVGVLLVRGGA